MVAHTLFCLTLVTMSSWIIVACRGAGLWASEPLRKSLAVPRARLNKLYVGQAGACGKWRWWERHLHGADPAPAIVDLLCPSSASAPAVLSPAWLQLECSQNLLRGGVGPILFLTITTAVNEWLACVPCTWGCLGELDRCLSNTWLEGSLPGSTSLPLLCQSLSQAGEVATNRGDCSTVKSLLPPTLSCQFSDILSISITHFSRAFSRRCDL